jgi:hypothetical protein
VAGGVVYGRRQWPGGVRRQSLVCLLVTTVALTSVALLPGAVGMGFGLAVGGAFQAAVLVTRNLSLRERLPAASHTAGYAIMYAATGVGYSIVAASSALVLTFLSPAAAVLGGGMVTLVIVAAGGLAERERPRGKAGTGKAGAGKAERAATGRRATAEPSGGKWPDGLRRWVNQRTP